MIQFIIKLFFRILRFNKKKEIDLIHLPLPDIYIITLKFIRKLIKVPVITRVAGDELSPFRKKDLWYLNRILVGKNMLKLDGIQVLNPMTNDDALNLGYPKEKLFLIPNGVNVPSETKKYDRLTNNLLYIGAMRFFPRKQKIEQKNLFFLIDSFKELLLKQPDMKLLLVGDGNLKPKLEEYVRSLNITCNVTFVGYQTKTLQYLLSSDIFINPSRYEGMPNAVLEAMSAGTSVFCSDIPEHRFLIGDNKYGELFRIDDKENLNEKIIDFYKNPKKYSEKAQKAQRYMEENFQWKKYCSQI